MESQRLLCLFLFLFTLFSVTQATKFYVGESQGWVPKPCESYKQWSRRHRFQINDSLVFRYTRGLDSVLQVKKEDYEKCNTENPIKKFKGGGTVFKFDRSGPFYFISGQYDHCNMGQKLDVLVLSPRSSPPKHSPSPRGSPAHSPSPSPAPSHGAKSPSPSPAMSPVHYDVSPAPSHGDKSPSPSPASLPEYHGGSPAHSPGAESPSSSPVISPVHHDGSSPSPAPFHHIRLR